MNKKNYLMRPFGGEEVLEAMKKVFESKYLTEGEFEGRFPEYVGAKHGIIVTSCAIGIDHDP